MIILLNSRQMNNLQNALICREQMEP